MNRKLIWAAAAPTFLILLSGLFLLNGCASTESEATSTVAPQQRAVDDGPVEEIVVEPSVASDQEPFDPLPQIAVESSAVEPTTIDAEAILTAPIADLILADDRGELQTMTDAGPVSPLLSGVSVGVPGVGEPVALAELDVDSLLRESPDEESLEEATVGTVPENSSKKTGKDAKPKVNGKDDEDDKHVRVTVALIEPKGEAVKPLDEIIIRSRAKGLRRAFVLVRARQKDAPWWVQEEAIRNGYYFRSRAQFGNAKTLDGTRFEMVFAFTGEDDEVPESGVFFHDIPLRFTLSQEFEVTLDKE